MTIAQAGFFVVALAFSGCAAVAPALTYTPTYGRFFLELADEGSTTVVLPKSGTRIAINPKPVFTENDVSGVELMQVDLGRCLMFQFTPAAARDLYRLSASNQGRRLVLMLNGVAVGARRLDGPLGEGTLLTFVERPDEELPALVENLKKSAAAVQREIARR
ncbi:MAG: hypothetical protein ABIZ49_00830 [Opitutaceae bacterium]